MFIFKEEVKEHNRKIKFNHPLADSKVTFMKVAGRVFINFLEYFAPFPNMAEKIEAIKKTFPDEWQADMQKVWIEQLDLDVMVKNFNKGAD